MRNQDTTENRTKISNTIFVATLDAVTNSQGLVGSAPPTCKIMRRSPYAAGVFVLFPDNSYAIGRHQFPHSKSTLRDVYCSFLSNASGIAGRKMRWGTCLHHPESGVASDTHPTSFVLLTQTQNKSPTCLAGLQEGLQNQPAGISLQGEPNG